MSLIHTPLTVLVGLTYDGNPACVNKEALTALWVSDLWIKTDENVMAIILDSHPEDWVSNPAGGKPLFE